MIPKSIKRATTAFGCVLGMALFAPAAIAQTISIGDVEVVAGQTTAVVPISVDHNFDLAAFVVAVTFDNEPLVDSYNPQYFDGEDGIDCPAFVGALNYSCSTPNPNEFRYVVNSGSPAVDIPAGQFGIITFELTGADVGDVITLSIDNESYSDQDGNVVPPSGDSTGGTITIVSGPPAILDVDPTDINFGNVTVGDTTGESLISICNDATDPDAADLIIDDITLSGTGFDESSDTCGSPLAPGACCTYGVTFSPDDEGPFSGSVEIETSAGDVTVTLSGEGRFTDAELVIDPTSFDFGELDINEAAICEVFTLSNTPGDDPLTIDTAAIFGGAISPRGASGPTAFEIVDNNCDGVTLGGGESCTIEVCFDPDEAISYFGELNVTSDANSVSADLEGLGTEESDVTVFPPFSQDADDVISIGVGEPGSTVSFTDGLVSNSGSADAEVACEFTSNPGDVFSTDPSPLAGTIPAVDGSIAFSLFCDLPGDADEGDTFNATLSCSVDGEPAGEHFLSCGVRVFDPVPVNTMQPLGLALFALLMLLIGGISIRLFRAS